MARSWLAAVAALAGAAAVVSSLLLPWLAERRILAAYGESPRRVIALARDARALDPYAVEAYFQEAEAQASLGNLPRAWQLYPPRPRRQPDNKETWFRLGEFELHTLDRPQLAYPHLLRFVQLDPQGPGGEVYHEALDRVNAGAKQ